jgi:glycosyltransferase involved in cell wall biosynthesis
VIGDAGFTTEASVQPLAEALARALAGERPPTDPLSRARLYDWDNVASQAETTYERAVSGQW